MVQNIKNDLTKQKIITLLSIIFVLSIFGYSVYIGVAQRKKQHILKIKVFESVRVNSQVILRGHAHWRIKLLNVPENITFIEGKTYEIILNGPVEENTYEFISLQS